MSILVAVVSRSEPPAGGRVNHESYGFRALKPAITASPQFLEMLVSRLSSADHALCANALQLMNSLMRDAIVNGEENEWPKFIKRLQDLGVIRAVYALMQSSALQDLAQPLLDFQVLTKVLLRKWRTITVDFSRPDHRRALRQLQEASAADADILPLDNADDNDDATHSAAFTTLGFQSPTPGPEFAATGFLGMMDLSAYMSNHASDLHKILLEQSTTPASSRCPIARASLAVTSILYTHFEVAKTELDDAKGAIALDSRAGIDRLFTPLLLQWARLHAGTLHAFLRLWKATGAEDAADFGKIVELVRILVAATVGSAGRTKDVGIVEADVEGFELKRLREWQMELVEARYEDSWGSHLRHIRDELGHEALLFLKEQRIRCLLAGAWFPKREEEERDEEAKGRAAVTMWRFVRLSPNRRWLHYADYKAQTAGTPGIEELVEKSAFFFLFLSLPYFTLLHLSYTHPLTNLQSTSPASPP